jgi:hypothetical protein
MKNRMHFLGASALALVLTAAAPAMADFSSLDADADSHINQGEFNAELDNNGTFRAWDADQNGFMSADEYDGGVHTRRDKMNIDDESGDNTWDYNTWDANADANIDNDEFNTGIFNAYDRDGDGVLDLDEYNRYQEEKDKGFWDF